MDAAERLPAPARLHNAQGTSRYVLLCEHASRFIPESYRALGLGPEDLSRHIAWDIGAANVAMRLSDRLQAPLILAGYSRLLIDLNRPLHSRTSIPDISETTVIPGNLKLTEAERARRAAAYFEPFERAVRSLLDARKGAGTPTVVVGIHSFTPVYKGVARPWHAGILFRRSRAFGQALVVALGGAAAAVAENEPYQIDDESDYTVPVHGEARGLDAVLVELRQDLVAGDDGAALWASKLADALQDERVVGAV